MTPPAPKRLGLWVVMGLGVSSMAPVAGAGQDVSLENQVGLSKPAFGEELDTLSQGEWWKKDPTKVLNWNKGEDSVIKDLKVAREDVIAFGVYTVHRKKLKLTAQLFPLYPNEDKQVQLEIERSGEWVKIASEEINKVGWSALFQIENWDDSRAWKYRLRHGTKASYEGTIRKNPLDQARFSVAVLSCNSSKSRSARPLYVRNINHHNPDLVFFAGDQHYDHEEHTAAWLMFGRQFREVFRHRPCVVIPDDHDVGHGNLWGEGGKASKQKTHFNDGGYRHHPAYVNMVERCQTGHLPDPYDPTPVAQGIGVYYTSYQIGGMDFAILEDRKFKSAPLGNVPQLGKRIDMVTNRAYKPGDFDKPGLKLLGDRQMKFLAQWANDNRPGVMKAVLSQSPFCNASYKKGLLADLDSNGWPQSARGQVIDLLAKANAVHLTGDQHIATLLQHNTEGFETGPWSFCSPAIVNTIYKRYWKPPAKAKKAPVQGNDLPFAGHFDDSFGNPITVHAYANPEPDHRGEGYGLVHFNKKKQSVTFECWPRRANVTREDAAQYAGWPKTVRIPFSDKP